MNALELISQVEQLGITLRVVGDKLRVKAQLGIITSSIKAELASHKPEIIQLLSKPSPRLPAGRVYQAVVDTNGVHKSMAVICPCGDDLSKIRETINDRFGAERVISIEPWRCKRPPFLAET